MASFSLIQDLSGKLKSPEILLAQQFGATEKTIADEVQREIRQRKQEKDREEQARRTEQTRKLQRQRQEQQAEEMKAHQEQAKRERAREHFRVQIDAYIDRLEENAQRWQHRYNWLQVTLLFFSALTATMAGIDGIPRLVVSVAGFIATVAGSLLTTFKIQERIYTSRKASAEARLECQKYDYHVEEYKSIDTEDAFIQFSKNMSAIQGQQMLQEVELWNPKKEEQKQETLLIQDKKELRDQPEQITQEEREAQGQQEESLTTSIQES